jgi:holo-[acyl-carrier protein] synthase
MIGGIGIDMIEVNRFKDHHHDPDGEVSIPTFTPGEVEYCRSKRYPARHFAARFAAKEAFLKATGTGAVTPGEFGMVEVVNMEGGSPSLVLTGIVKDRFEERGFQRIHLSLSHTADRAIAFVILEK